MTNHAHHEHSHAHDHTHDHSECGNRDTLLARAQTVCDAAGESFTPLRRRVLELLIDAEGPAKAYDLMSQVSEDGKPAKPPTVYRTLDFLIRVGLVHKIESLNAFVACGHAHDHGVSLFMICQACGKSIEVALDDVASRLREVADQAKFVAERTVIEMNGRCANCAKAA
jgi:Fur family transcriptional regulator, zinc uptake regulator